VNRNSRWNLGGLAAAVALALLWSGCAFEGDQLDVASDSSAIGTPKGFDGWSEDCKKEWRKLQREYDERAALEKKIGAAATCSRKDAAACKQLAEKVDALQRELAEVNAFIKGYGKERGRIRREQRAARHARARDINRRYRAGQLDKDAAMAEWHDLKAEQKKELAELKDRLGRSKRRRREIRKQLATLRRKLAACRKKCATGRGELGGLNAKLGKMRSFEKIGSDMEALRKECGPQDPAVGAASIPLSLPDPDPIGSTCDARYWNQDCVELIFVEGGDLPGGVSNPVTTHMASIMKDVNDLWGQCCVKYSAYFKRVALSRLGKLDVGRTGVYRDRDTIHIASTKTMAKAGRPWRKAIRDLQDHKECMGILVVDAVDDKGLAGFAASGGRVGVVTAFGGGLTKTGEVAAHEIGHGIGGINHEYKDPRHPKRTKKHAHGELMWGKPGGKPPMKKSAYMTYWKLNKDDCSAMRAKTKATKLQCVKKKRGR